MAVHQGCTILHYSLNLVCYMDPMLCVKRSCGLRPQALPAGQGESPPPRNLDKVTNRRRREGSP